MIEEKEYFEDDSHGISDKYMQMSQEEIERELQRLYEEMKDHPQEKKPVKRTIKCLLDY
ncbi:hypothetical protein [Butyrivibrio sp. XBB1001]|uniref:hypothetical protein n=1 Tax=Butyrivibrio sp. XBB1001 TaxID=1280682 RepID=UPI00040EDDB5|nr:hypothetical protein [Butyrivibrio sp. XBB1001]